MNLARLIDTGNKVSTQSGGSCRKACVRILSIILILALFFLTPSRLSAQDQNEEYEEISVFLAVQGIGGYDITAIYKNDEIYLPVTEMLQCLKINYRISEFGDTISGFFLDENNKYYISKPGNTIYINGKLIQLTGNELLNTESTSLALRLDQYGKLFGLDCRFNFNSLSVELKTSHELPVIKELRLEQMRKNINRLRGDISVDTTYDRRYHLLRGGMVDWAVYSTQIVDGPVDTRVMLGLGTEFLGGETNIELNYSTRDKFDKRQQQYHWRWANNSIRPVKQITVGKISSRSVSSIYSPLIGAVITNSPTTFRRSFGSYTISDFTEPGWVVELYINNVVVNYTTADASGFYKFDIPLVYGSSNVLLKFYGPWGEERQKEQTINVPYNFLPKGEMQYSVSGAFVQDSSHSLYSRSDINFGVSRHLTVGGGFEYLSSIISGPSIPFVNGSAQLLNNYLFFAEYAYGVRTKALLSYSLPSSFSIEVDYTKYAKEQKAITYNYLEERKLRVSIPIPLKKVKAYSRLSYIQNILEETTYSTAEATLSAYYNGVSANFTGYANWLKNTDTYIYGNLGLGFRFFQTLSFRPQLQYDFSNNNVIFTKVELENNFSPKCNLSLIWENNIRNNINSVELTFKYNLSFARTSLSTRISNNYIMTGQSAMGSFAFGSGNGRVIADPSTQVGKAGLTVVPFLDINNNNRRDENEPITYGMDLRMNGGRILPDSRDSIIRIMDLEPFASYMIEFNDTQFDNISWQIQKKTLSILMDPNQFKLLEVPIKVMGEINGMIYMKTGNNLRGQGRILINIFDESGNFIAKTQSESDGYYTYLGLPPGSYYAEVDSMQLTRLKLVSSPRRHDFGIQPSEYGDIIDNVEFQLLKQAVSVESEIPVVEKKITPVPEVKPIMKEPVMPAVPVDISKIDTKKHRFFIQAGAFKYKYNADRLQSELKKLTSQNWVIDYENGLYKVRLGYFTSMDAARNYKVALNTPDIYYYVNEILGEITPDERHNGSDSFEQLNANAIKALPVTKKEPEKAIPAAEIKTEQPVALKENEGARKNESEKVMTVPVVKAEPPVVIKEEAKAAATAKDVVTTPADNKVEAVVPSKYFIQAGAFESKVHAERLASDLLGLTLKRWFIVYDKGLYKVRLGYFLTKEAAKHIESTLNTPEIPYYVDGVPLEELPALKKNGAESSDKEQTSDKKISTKNRRKEARKEAEKTPVLKYPDTRKEDVSKSSVKNEQPETIIKKGDLKQDTKNAMVLTPDLENAAKATGKQRFFIQADAFINKSSAEQLVNHLTELTRKKWFIVYEDELYKVRIGYFESKDDAKYTVGTLNTPDIPYYIDELQVENPEY